MKNINAIFYSIMTVSIFSISYASMGEKAAEVAAKGLEGASQTMAKTITDAAPGVGIDAAKNLGDAGIAMSKNLGDSGKDISKNLVLGVAIVAGVYALREIAYAGKGFYQYCYPDEDKKKQKTIAILNTERVFRECLLKNAKGPRNKTTEAFKNGKCFCS